MIPRAITITEGGSRFGCFGSYEGRRSRQRSRGIGRQDLDSRLRGVGSLESSRCRGRGTQEGGVRSPTE